MKGRPSIKEGNMQEINGIVIILEKTNLKSKVAHSTDQSDIYLKRREK